MSNRNLENVLRGLLEKHGFVVAAKEIKLDFLSKKKLITMIDSWKNFPKSMDVYPSQLTPKFYPDI